MGDSIHIKIKTMSNLFIGGAPAPFEIGGIDQRTITDQDGFPYIPGSSLKGALRAIVREDRSEMAEEFEGWFRAYLEREKEKNWPQIECLVKDKEALNDIEKRYQKAIEQASPEHLFGIEGFNDTPKLFFSDLLLCDKSRDKKSYFSIDMKNSIDTKRDAPQSNPRTYQTASKYLEFEGKITLYKMELLDSQAGALCKEYILYNLAKFNEGFYRLGNSKSRGYGKVKLVTGEEEECDK